jgi:hypothetical protein
MNSLGVKLPVAQDFGKKSINIHHFGTKYNHPPIRRIPQPSETPINRSIEKN